MAIYHYDKNLKKVVEGPPPQQEAREVPFYIMPLFKEYRAVGIDNRVVKTRTDHKNMLRDHGYIEVGNEQHPSVKEKQREREERSRDVKRES